MEQRRYACDTCRRRRVRCDASQPCTRCVHSGIACTYGSVTGRQSATSYARHLEQRIAELQHQLQTLVNPVPGTVASSSTDAVQIQHDPVDLLVGPGDDLVLQRVHGKKVYRSSAALNVLRTIADMLGSGHTATLPGRTLVEVLETPIDLPARGPLDWLGALLPNKEQIWTKAVRAIDTALFCHECIDRNAFRTRLEAMPDPPGGISTPEYSSFLALVYALLALGELYAGTPNHGQTGCEMGSVAAPPGINYFRASRYIILNEYDHVDLNSVTAMVFQARYLLSASTFSDAHAALSTATAAAMHMGLHLHDASLQDSFTEAELYDRRRVFAVLCMIETYVAFALGMPRVLHAADPRQTLGLTREDLLDEGASLIARDPTTPEAETVLNQKLMRIYAKILDRQSEQSVETYPTMDWTFDIETELREWERLLPDLSQATSSNQRVLQGQLNFRLHYAGVYILLYAPCIHHLGRERSDPAWSITGYEHASTCLSAATRSVFLVETLQAHGLLNEVHWLNSYILAWAATILAYFVIHARTRVTIAESKRAALLAYEILGKLGSTRAAARGIHQCLAPYMDIVSTISE